MLLEKSAKLIELSKRKIQLQKYAKNQQGFKSREEQIKEYYQQVLEIVEPLRLFANKELIKEDFSSLVEKLLYLVQLNVKKYKENREWILDNENFAAAKYKSSINKLTTTIQTQLLQAWQNYLKRELPSTNPELLNTLGQIDEFKQTIYKIHQLERQIPRDKLPKDPKEFDHIENVIQQLNDAWHTLNSNNVPDEVLTFLKAAGTSTGASLNLLTPTVIAWLKEYHLSDTLRVHLI